MNKLDKQYIDLLHKIMEKGEDKESRSGMVRSCFGHTISVDLTQDGFPLLTTKKVFYRGVLEELFWFLSGSTNIKPLIQKGVHIWDDDAYRYFLEKFPFLSAINKDTFLKNVIIEMGSQEYKFGDLGEVYGKNWRAYGQKGFDQIAFIVNELKNNPDSRRMLLDAYNPETAYEAALPPCHVLYQFNTSKVGLGERALNCQFYCRSTDTILGLPFNIASAAFLVHMLAKTCGMIPGTLTYVGGDVHIYHNQFDAVQEQMARTGSDKLPHLEITNSHDRLEDYVFEEFVISGYNPDPAIYAPLSVG